MGDDRREGPAIGRSSVKGAVGSCDEGFSMAGVLLRDDALRGGIDVGAGEGAASSFISTGGMESTSFEISSGNTVTPVGGDGGRRLGIWIMLSFDGLISSVVP